jgi:ribonuclease-3
MESYVPYNRKNKAFRESCIQKILHSHGLPGYRIQGTKVYQQAMVHSTYVRRTEYTTPDGEPAQLAPCPPGVMDLFPESYECLEFEGDAVLGCCIATYLRQRYPDKKEGFLTDLRKELVNNQRLGELSQKIGLPEFFVISRHNEEAVAIHGRTNTKKLGDILEAFIGALWTDCGNRFDIVYTFVRTVIERYVDIPKVLQTTTNWKDVFQKYCQKTYKFTPTYILISTENAVMRVAVVDPDSKHLGYGEGTTKKEAEQNACHDAYLKCPQC